MRAMKTGGSLGLPNIPVVHPRTLSLLLLLALFVLVSGYCIYRYKGGKSFRRIIRRKLRHRRRRAEQQSPPS